MDASKENGVSDSRAVYTPPCVVRMSDLRQGTGLCSPMGSGDSEGGCGDGNFASAESDACKTGHNPIDE